MNSILRGLCLADTEDLLFMFGGEVNIEKGYTFIDHGSNVLAIAHLDVVDDHDFAIKKKRAPRGYAEYFVANKKTANRLRVPAIGLPYTMAETIALDDRLGLYVIMELLPAMGVLPDILLTTNEEIGQSSASEFLPPRQYNWMFQFDRHGTGNVMYQYQDEGLVSLLQSEGFKVERGSYSDIAFLEHLGCKGINFGVGYEDEHTPACYANLDQVYQLALKFSEFFSKYEYTPMPHTPIDYEANWKTGGRYGEYWTGYGKFYLGKDDYSELDVDYCLSCGMENLADELVDGLCPDCLYVIEKVSDWKKAVDEKGKDTWEDDIEYCAYCGQEFTVAELEKGLCHDCQKVAKDPADWGEDEDEIVEGDYMLDWKDEEQEDCIDGFIGGCPEDEV